MHNFIKILKKFQEIGPVSLFFRIININVYAKVYQNIPHSYRDRAIFTFSEFGTQQSLDQ